MPCPRHLNGYSRDCPDARCQQHWSPPGAPSPEEQLQRWVFGDSVCPNSRHECCPDFSCCRPDMQWPPDKRVRFVAAPQGEREKMMMGSLGALAEETASKIHITRGDPADHK
jgi:hypothetical protein